MHHVARGRDAQNSRSPFGLKDARGAPHADEYRVCPAPFETTEMSGVAPVFRLSTDDSLSWGSRVHRNTQNRVCQGGRNNQRGRFVGKPGSGSVNPLPRFGFVL
jgi:hypothetical protein